MSDHLGYCLKPNIQQPVETSNSPWIPLLSPRLTRQQPLVYLDYGETCI